MTDFFEFLNYPKIVSGKCALENIPSELDSYGVQKPLVITDKQIAGRGLVKQFIKAFYDSTVVLGAVYDEVIDYACISLARDAAKLFRVRGCDAIIALGNGPVVDLAKAVAILVSNNTNSLQPHYEGIAFDHPLKPLIVVPTCTMNGFEATIFLPAIISKHKNDGLPIRDEFLLAMAGPEVYARTPKKERAEKVIKCIRNLNQDLHKATCGKHPRSLKEALDCEGKPLVPKSMLPVLSQSIMDDGARLTNPEELLPTDARFVLEHAWEGTPLDSKKIRKGGNSVRY